MLKIHYLYNLHFLGYFQIITVLSKYISSNKATGQAQVEHCKFLFYKRHKLLLYTGKIKILSVILNDDRHTKTTQNNLKSVEKEAA